MMLTWQEAAVTADDRNPSLPEYATGQALRLITKDLAADNRDGIVVKGRISNAPQVGQPTPANAPTIVIITDCAGDQEWLRYKADGTVVTPGAGGSHRIAAEAVLVGGAWMVDKLDVYAAGTC